MDVVLLEVGMGGQYDATSVIEKPTVCGITSLGYDHMPLLGKTLAEIAWHKAGIMKVRCARTHPSAGDLFPTTNFLGTASQGCRPTQSPKQTRPCQYSGSARSNCRSIACDGNLAYLSC